VENRTEMSTSESCLVRCTDGIGMKLRIAPTE
jgi:hypothetical protein